jgi:hypothetical protein
MPHRRLSFLTALSNFSSLATIFHTSNHPSMFSINTPGTGTRLLSAIFSGLMRLRCYIILLHRSFYYPFPPHSGLPLFILPSGHPSPMRNTPYVQTIITSYFPFFPKPCYPHFSVITSFLIFNTSECPCCFSPQIHICT